MRKRLEEIICFVDGGANNKTHSDAYGSFLVIHNGDVFNETFELDSKTSNEAEYSSLIKLLQFILQYDGYEKYFWRIYTDSRLLVNHTIGKWKVDAKNLLPLHLTTKELYDIIPYKWIDWISRKYIEGVLGH